MTSWGETLRGFREVAKLTRDELADSVFKVCEETAENGASILAKLRIYCPESLSAGQIANFELNRTVPVGREMHLLLLLTFVRLGVIANRATANMWLEQARHGWLSDRETSELFRE